MITANNTASRHLQVAERVDLNCSHHKKEKVVMWHKGGAT